MDKKSKRRPGRDPETKNETKKETRVSSASVAGIDTQVVDVETGNTIADEVVLNSEVHATHSDSSSNSSSESVQNSQNAFFTDSNGDRVKINFKGSDALREKFPKPFDIAEIIVTDWLRDGRFEALPLGHPLAQYFAAKGLRKAKQIEKKVLESPVTEKIAIQALTAGLKAQEIISQVRSKIKK